MLHFALHNVQFQNRMAKVMIIFGNRNNAQEFFEKMRQSSRLPPEF